eukprot:CAMPEP_0194488866 /NCGR_PEP_ID=MMETSP0253-20130528/8629_1 /TAXON_ID=2966 /ORGANISM="Noctiluca scintillans" /LENGTH=311 /DNA_ID=CAMNT_0039329275 /DNA_START=95 /DNA_END=1030 /DNA_ORIENTATION=-
MGWGGKGKGFGLVGSVVGGAVTGAVVATLVGPPPRPPSRTEVVVVETCATEPDVQTCRVVKGGGKSKGPPKVVQRVSEAEPTKATLPAEGQEKRGSVLFFAVDVRYDDGSTWRTMRNYSDFTALYHGLGSVTFPHAPFPGTTGLLGLGKCEGGKLAERRWMLEAWLQRVIDHPQRASIGPWRQDVRDFLGKGCYVLDQPDRPPLASPTRAPPARAVPPTAAVAVPQNPPPSAPPSEGSGEGARKDFAGEEWIDLVTVEIVVPEAVTAGQMLGVDVDGRRLQVEVPSGYSCGSHLYLWYDADAGSLIPVAAQ